MAAPCQAQLPCGTGYSTVVLCKGWMLLSLLPGEDRRLRLDLKREYLLECAALGKHAKCLLSGATCQSLIGDSPTGGCMGALDVLVDAIDARTFAGI